MSLLYELFYLQNYRCKENTNYCTSLNVSAAGEQTIYINKTTNVFCNSTAFSVTTDAPHQKKINDIELCDIAKVTN
jgi:hypothetical protein